MTVYIVFGDEPRTDGDNILGVFASFDLAHNFVETYYSDSIYPPTIMDFEVEGIENGRG